MNAEHAIDGWHLEVTHAVLRRYSGQDARAAFAARAPYDAVMHVDLRGGLAYMSAALATTPPLSRADRRVIERLLRRVGAETSQADRGGGVRELRAERSTR